jgi:carboxyl-terminal processing protease
VLDDLNIDESSTGLILDLRDTYFGRSKSASRLVDLFVESGTIGIRKDFAPDADHRFEAKFEGTIRNCPIVVIINGGTAFTAELAAGALKVHDRAVLVGTHTAGAGRRDTAFPMSDHYKLWMTTGEYLLPSGRSYSGLGIAPDRTVVNLLGDEQLETAIEILESIKRKTP